jgi:hypothetical protein
MQQALDALQEYVAVVVSVNDPNDWTPKVADAGEPARKAIEALRARLVQPEPTLALWNFKHNRLAGLSDDRAEVVLIRQREWQGLTDETEIKHCWYEACQTDLELTSQLVVYFARAIEAKLKEKNGF